MMNFDLIFCILFVKWFDLFSVILPNMTFLGCRSTCRWWLAPGAKVLLRYWTHFQDWKKTLRVKWRKSLQVSIETIILYYWSSVDLKLIGLPLFWLLFMVKVNIRIFLRRNTQWMRLLKLSRLSNQDFVNVIYVMTDWLVCTAIENR